MKIWLHYVTKNSPRLPEDPGDATDDDTCHPDEPTEPPDDAESMRVRDSEERVEARVSEVSTGRADETAESDSTTGTRTESDSDEGMPGSSEDDSEDPGGGTDRHEVVEVEPGGETTDRRNGSVADEDADADVGRVAGEARRGAQVEGESAGTRRDISIERERGSVSALERSMTTDKKTISAPYQMTTTYLRTHPSHQMWPHGEETSPRALSSRGSGRYLQAVKSDLPATKQTCWDRPMVMRTLGTDLRGR